MRWSFSCIFYPADNLMSSGSFGVYSLEFVWHIMVSWTVAELSHQKQHAWVREHYQLYGTNWIVVFYVDFRIATKQRTFPLDSSVSIYAQRQKSVSHFFHISQGGNLSVRLIGLRLPACTLYAWVSIRLTHTKNKLIGPEWSAVEESRLKF